jgi:arylsulfatase A-like enzyme
MPFLERLAADGIAFDQAYAPSSRTIGTIPQMLSGRFLTQIRLGEQANTRFSIHPAEKLITEDLKELGVSTHAVLEHAVFRGMNQGWTAFENSWRRHHPIAANNTVRALVDRVIVKLGRLRGQRFFLYAHTMDAHDPYRLQPRHAHWGDTSLGRYRSELARIDHELRRLHVAIAALTDRPTIFIVTADHGEAFGEHGVRFHGQNLHREAVHVPLVVWYEGVTARRVDGPVSLLDLTPTLRNLYGLEPRSDHVGVSLLPTILHGRPPPSRPIYHQLVHVDGAPSFNFVAITWDQTRLLHDVNQYTFELYDLARDPRESINLADDDDPTFRARQAEMGAWLDAIQFQVR